MHYSIPKSFQIIWFRHINFTFEMFSKKIIKKRQIRSLTDHSIILSYLSIDQEKIDSEILELLRSEALLHFDGTKHFICRHQINF